MEIRNLLDCITTRQQFRDWLANNAETEKECWLPIKKGKTMPDGIVWYLDAVEEALCFGWIDSTCKTINGITIQRFTPRSKSSNWTELNKERCRRLIRLGLMTHYGMETLPDLDKEFEIYPEVLDLFKKNKQAWDNFNAFHPLYQRVRIDKIHNEKNRGRLENFQKRLIKLIEASEKGKMIGDWDDFGRLSDY